MRKRAVINLFTDVLPKAQKASKIAANQILNALKHCTLFRHAL